MKDDDVGGISNVHGREEIYTLGFGRHAFGSRKRRCGDNIKMELKNKMGEGEWTHTNRRKNQ